MDETDGCDSPVLHAAILIAVWLFSVMNRAHTQQTRSIWLLFASWFINQCVCVCYMYLDWIHRINKVTINGSFLPPGIFHSHMLTRQRKLWTRLRIRRRLLENMNEPTTTLTARTHAFEEQQKQTKPSEEKFSVSMSRRVRRYRRRCVYFISIPSHPDWERLEAMCVTVCVRAFKQQQ